MTLKKMNIKHTGIDTNINHCYTMQIDPGNITCLLRHAILLKKSDVVEFIYDYSKKFYPAITINDIYETVVQFENSSTTIIKFVLDKGADIYYKKCSVIDFAIKNCRWQIILTLLEYKLDVHYKNDYILKQLCEQEYKPVELLDSLIAYGANIHVDNDFPLRRSALIGDHQYVSKLLLNGSDVHADNDYAIRMAARCGHLEVVQILLQYGANIQVDNDYPIWAAIQFGRIQVFKLLLKSNKYCKEKIRMYVKHIEESCGEQIKYLMINEILAICVINGDTELLMFLQKFDVDLNMENDRLSILAAKKGHLNIVQYLHERNVCNQYAVSVASRYGHLEIVKYLCQQNISIHYNNNSAVCEAARYGHLEIVKYLISRGANISDLNDYPLFIASSKGNLDIVKILIQNNANVNANHGCALRFAAKNKHCDVVRFLLENGADIKLLVKNGQYIGALKKKIKQFNPCVAYEFNKHISTMESELYIR